MMTMMMMIIIIIIIMMMMMMMMMMIIIIIITIANRESHTFASDESHYFTRQTSGILQLLESRPSQLLLSWAPFLEKGPLNYRRGPTGPSLANF